MGLLILLLQLLSWYPLAITGARALTERETGCPEIDEMMRWSIVQTLPQLLEHCVHAAIFYDHHYDNAEFSLP